MKLKQTKNTNIYIHQLQAEKYLQINASNENITFEDLKLNFNGSLPDNMELRYIQKKYPSKFSIVNDCIRTTCIIDVSFNDDYKELTDNPINVYKNGKIVNLEKSYGDVILNKLNIRKQFYTDGFIINGIKYVLFKRSSSKSRLSQCLFIEESILADIQKWSRMNLEFAEDEPCDIASLMAYESLTLSGITGTIHIEPHEILLIDDYKKDFTAMASVTEYDTKLKRLVVNERMEPQTSDIFDGQSLLDVSVFTGEYENKGCLLLRNKFFKSCAFNSNIQLWFKDNNITEISQLNGFTLAKNISDIKMITTPNSLKALKFAYKLGCPKESEKKEMFKYWLDHIDFDYGVCKYEKPSPFGDRNQLSYQMINSLPLTYDEVLKLAEFNISQIDSINNDFESFKEHISIGDKIDISREMLYNICCVNPDIVHTELYKSKRREIVKGLKLNMKKGKLLVNGDYATIVSNPIEMLKNACRIEWSESLHKPYEVYSPMYNDGDILTGFRNPHIASGNVCVLTNKYIAEIDKYMNLTRNICVFNSYENDILARLQGADMDSDSVLLVKQDTILSASKECQSFYTPLNRIKGDKQERKYNKIDMAETDYCIGENMIGQIVNLSQLFNSYYWHYRNIGVRPQKLQTICDCVSMLSSLSQMEIDKAKKFFTLNVRCQLKKVSNTVFGQNKLDQIKKEKMKWTGKKNRLKPLLDVDMNTANKIGYFNVCELINRIEYELEKQKDNIEEFTILKKERSILLSKKTRLNSKINKNMNEIIKTDYEAACLEEEKLKQRIKAFIKCSKVIQLSEVQLTKVMLSDSDCDKIKEYDAMLEIGEINEKKYDELVSSYLTYGKLKQNKPSFFIPNSKDKNCNFSDFITPMDFLVGIVGNNKIIKKALPDKNCMSLDDLLIGKRPEFDADRKHTEKIETIAVKASEKLQSCFMKYSGASKFDYKGYKHEKESIIRETIRALKKVKVSKPETILTLLQRCYSDSKKRKKDKLSPYKSNLVSLLYKAHTELFIRCFEYLEKSA